MQKIFIENRHGLKMAVRLTIDGSNSKLVFLEHGLSSRKEYPHMLVLEELFAKYGYNVVNFDATNSLNESESSEQGLTFSGHFKDLEDVVNWAKTQQFYTEPFALAGQSLGAGSVVKYAGVNPAKVNLLIPCAFPYLDKNHIDFDKRIPSILEKGYYDQISKSTGKILKIKTAYFEDFKNLNLVPYIKNITANTYIIIGSQDSEEHITNSKKLFNLLATNKQIFILDGVPHDLANNERDKRLFEKTVDEILKRFTHNQTHK